MAAVRMQRDNIQRYIWLMSGLLCLLLAFIFWLMTDKEQLVEVKKTPESEAQTQIQPEKVGSMTHLGALLEEVRPLELTTRIVASGIHEPEFRGTKFMLENKKLWTNELFRSSEEDIIKSFLKKQPQRNNFIYFRLSGEEQTEQYVLAYGKYKTAQEAEQALDQLNLVLPPSLKPHTQKFEDYAAFVNDLGSEEMSGSAKVREIVLKPAALPKIDESLLSRTNPAATTAQTNNALSTVKTTITRRDQEGNVVDVQRSQSNIPVSQPSRAGTSADASRPVENEISDPFN